MSNELRCSQCGTVTVRGPATCPNCGASMRSALPVDESWMPPATSPSENTAVPAKPPKMKVIVTDFDMPFGSMVGFMVKWAFASIPALFILFVVGFFASAILAAIFGAAVGLGR